MSLTDHYQSLFYRELVAHPKVVCDDLLLVFGAVKKSQEMCDFHDRGVRIAVHAEEIVVHGYPKSDGYFFFAP